MNMLSLKCFNEVEQISKNEGKSKPERYLLGTTCSASELQKVATIFAPPIFLLRLLLVLELLTKGVNY